MVEHKAVVTVYDIRKLLQQFIAQPSNSQ